MREDLSPGYQIAQTAHSIAEWAFKRPRTFRKWRKESAYVISLSAPDLKGLMLKLLEHNVDFVPFFEPDIGEVTAITITPNNLADSLTKKLNLAGKVAGTKNKHGT